MQRGKRHLVEPQRPRKRVLFDPFDVLPFADNQPRLRPAEQLVARKRRNVHTSVQTSLHRRLAADAKRFEVDDCPAAEVFNERQAVPMRDLRQFLPRYGFGKAHDAVVARMHLQKRSRLLADGGFIVAPVRLVRRADLAQRAAALRHDLRNAERAADLDELAARGDDLSPARERGQDEQHRRGVVVHSHRRLRTRQAAQKRLHVLIARAAAAVFRIVFKRRIISRRLCRGVRRALAQAGAAKVRVQRHAGRVDDRAQRRQLLFLCTCQNARAEYACLRQRGKAAAHFVSQRVQLLAHALAQQHRRQRRHLELVPTEQLVHPRDGTKQIFFHAFPSPRPTRSASGASSPVCLYPIRKAFARQEKPEPFAESAMQFWFFYCPQEHGSSRGRKFSILENFCLFGTASCRGVPVSSPVGIKYGKLEVVDLKKWFSSNLSSRIVLLD